MRVCVVCCVRCSITFEKCHSDERRFDSIRFLLSLSVELETIATNHIYTPPTTRMPNPCLHESIVMLCTDGRVTIHTVYDIEYESRLVQTKIYPLTIHPII